MRDYARTFGGVVAEIYPAVLRGRGLTLFRYLWSFAATFASVVRIRPQFVVAMNPPIFSPLSAYIGCRLVGAKLIMDSHPGAFGLQGDPVGRWVQPVHRFLCRRAYAVFVTTPSLARCVARHGGRPVVAHEPPPLALRERPLQALGGPSYALAVTVFARDEPIAPLLKAAEQLRIAMHMTGEEERLGIPGKTLPENIKLLGFLPFDTYQSTLQQAAVAIVVTDEAESVPRSAYEATFLGIPLVISDTHWNRFYFPGAIHVLHSGDDIARAVHTWLDMPADVRAELSARAMERALEQWGSQRREIVELFQPRNLHR